MGVEHYVVDKSKKIFYDLGKGGDWYEFDSEAFQDLEYLTNEIIKEVFLVDEKPLSLDKENFVHYLTNRFAPDLFNHFGNSNPKDIIIFNDCGDDILICRSKGYKCIGTRYYDIGSKEHQDRLELENRHFRSTNPPHWYQPDLNHSLWEIY